MHGWWLGGWMVSWLIFIAEMFISWLSLSIIIEAKLCNLRQFQIWEVKIWLSIKKTLITKVQYFSSIYDFSLLSGSKFQSIKLVPVGQTLQGVALASMPQLFWGVILFTKKPLAFLHIEILKRITREFWDFWMPVNKRVFQISKPSCIILVKE